LGAPPSINPQTGAAEVRFWVRDNGQGLASESQSRLFIEFERLGQTGTPGHGLGLSIVKRIAEKLGGQVGFKAHQAKVVHFSLPCQA
jgi:two-component system sensor histidine kinase/response regulator